MHGGRINTGKKLKKENITKRAKKASFWVRRRSHLPVIIIGGLFVVVLMLDEDTSMTMNMKYLQQINSLKREIKANRDSAQYYRNKREALLTGSEGLERLAREQYHMQRPTEDVFLLEEQ